MRGYHFPVAALALCGLALLTVGARPAAANPANVELVSVTPEASFFRFNYQLTLAPSENLVAGDFFTIYDFNGLIPGSLAGPTGWVPTSALVGPTASDVLVADSAAIPNITFTYTDGPLPGPTTISGFSALSQYGSIARGRFTAETTDIGPDAGNISSVGPVDTPQVPEPGTLALLGAGLAIGAIATVRRRRNRA